MAPASPHRPPPPKPLLDLDVTVISAKHLKNVNWRNGDLKPYAVAYLEPDRRSATKSDDSGSTRPVWNEHLTLPLPFDGNDAYSQTLTLDIFHSRPSETPKPLVGTVRVPLKELVVDLDDFSSSAAIPPPIKTLELRRPSGRPQGKVRIKVAVRERPLPPPPEQNYRIPPPPPPSGYYYSTAPPLAAPMPQQPPPQPRDYRTFSQPPQPVAHYPSTVPSRQSQYSFHGIDDAAYYDPYYFSSGAAYYPPSPAPARPVYYDRPGPASYGGPSAPVDYSPSYEQKTKGSRMGLGAGLAVGAVAGALGGLALEEGLKYEEEKIVERVESDIAARDDYIDYHADY